MASGGERSCPICCNALRDVAYSLPCRHRFCLGCILRWLRWNRACPLCRTSIATVSFSEHCLHVLWHPRESPEAASPAGTAPGTGDGNTPGVPPAPSSSQGTLSPAGQGAAGPEAVGGILPELWAELFRRRWTLLDPVRSWLRQRLESIYGDKWWQVKVAESSVLLALCIFGPDRDALVQRLQLRLQEHTAPLVHGIVGIIEAQCSQEVRRLRRCHAPRAEAGAPGTSRSPPPARGAVPHPRGPEDAPQGSPASPRPSPRSASIPRSGWQQGQCPQAPLSPDTPDSGGTGRRHPGVSRCRDGATPRSGE